MSNLISSRTKVTRHQHRPLRSHRHICNRDQKMNKENCAELRKEQIKYSDNIEPRVASKEKRRDYRQGQREEQVLRLGFVSRKKDYGDSQKSQGRQHTHATSQAQSEIAEGTGHPVVGKVRPSLVTLKDSGAEQQASENY